MEQSNKIQDIINAGVVLNKLTDELQKDTTMRNIFKQLNSELRKVDIKK